MIGEKFGRLIVVDRETIPDKRGRYKWICLCECGNVTSVEGYKLRNGNTKSCGCYKLDLLRERLTKYEYKNLRIYHIWQDIKQRCTNRNHPAFRYYGGRGICICKEWFDDFLSFQEWSLYNGYSDGLTIDRIDNDGNYAPFNCRWVTMAVQNSNKRNNKTKKGSK